MALCQRGSWSANDNSGKGKNRSEEHTSELQSPCNLVCRLLLEKKKNSDAENARALIDHDASALLRHKRPVIEAGLPPVQRETLDATDPRDPNLGKAHRRRYHAV